MKNGFNLEIIKPQPKYCPIKNPINYFDNLKDFIEVSYVLLFLLNLLFLYMYYKSRKKFIIYYNEKKKLLPLHQLYTFCSLEDIF